MDLFIGALLFYFLFCLILICAYLGYNEYKKQKIRERVHLLFNNAPEISAKRFFMLKSEHTNHPKSPSLFSKLNFAGVYILHNTTKNKRYVGQSQRVMNRVSNHFSGSGNPNIHHDYIRGDNFTIKVVSLEDSGYSTLNEFERNTIMTYNTFANGYNKTRGNRG
ncbi:MAG: GIY-YIG nuclease family protein [Clostridia bacterium]|nr:GIY-YIG nuclease family protein [Clostridia bacterium]